MDKPTPPEVEPLATELVSVSTDPLRARQKKELVRFMVISIALLELLFGLSFTIVAVVRY